MTPIWYKRLAGLGLAFAVFVADQWLKSLVLFHWKLREVGQIEVMPNFNLTWTQNFGVSLGMFEAGSPEMRWVLVAVTALISCVVFVWLLRERLVPEILGLGLILGGALGNIRDRFSYGYVIDYADLHFGDFRPFLIFNLADAAISIGVAIILARALFMREKPANPDGDEAPQAGERAETPSETN
jgi:signal peptidase II